MIFPKRIKTAFTLIELMMTILVASVAVLAVGGVVADSHKGYSRMFTRVHGNVETDAYIARIKFDKICRMAGAGSAIVNTTVPSLTIEYYSAPNMGNNPYLPPDMFAEFSLNGTNLILTSGPKPKGTADVQETIAANVTELKFSAPLDGKSVQMVLTLVDNNHSLTVTCGSIMHN